LRHRLRVPERVGRAQRDVASASIGTANQPGRRGAAYGAPGAAGGGGRSCQQPTISAGRSAAPHGDHGRCYVASGQGSGRRGAASDRGRVAAPDWAGGDRPPRRSVRGSLPGGSRPAAAPSRRDVGAGIAALAAAGLPARPARAEATARDRPAVPAGGGIDLDGG
jgi:hypothetical protein